MSFRIFQAYFINTFCKSETYQKYQLAYLTAYARDQPGRFDNITTSEGGLKPINSGFAARAKMVELSVPVNSYFELPFDFCNSNAPIMPGSTIQISLTHQPDSYRLPLM